jgi:hypothetical protein
MRDYLRRAVEAIAGPHNRNWSEAVECLDNLGLLMTPEAEACVKACEGLCVCENVVTRQCVWGAGRASLAAKKPKERWVARPRHMCNVWDVECTKNHHWHGPFSKAEAAAMVKALNEVDG